MKFIKYSILSIIFFVNTQLLFAQEEPDPPPPPPPYFELSQEEEQQYLKNIDSELKYKLQEIKEQNKQKYITYLRDLHWRNMEHSFMLKGREKEMLKREQQIVEYEILAESLSIEYNKASSSKKESIKKELQKNLSNLFDLKEMQKENEVKMLEEQIENLKDKIVSRKKNKEIIIRRRVEELIGEGDYLKWD